jgi:allantoin racemase
MRLLLLNPNTSAHITDRLAASARRALAPGDRLDAVTGTQGPAVVRDARTLDKAEAEVRRLAPEVADGADAFVLGLSLDGVIETVRARFGTRPAVGMTEAAVAAAALLGRRVGLLTLGSAMLPLYDARLRQLLPAERIAGLEAPDLPQAFDSDATGVSTALLAPLGEAVQRLREAGADSVVLAGAVLCGYDRALAARAGCPVLDGVGCAVHLARAMLAVRS